MTFKLNTLLLLLLFQAPMNVFGNDVPKSKTDQSIEIRISKIMKASKWFPDLEVSVNEGLVFINGQYPSIEKKKWIQEIINKTEGVVAVIDNAEFSFKGTNTLSPAGKEIDNILLKAQKLSPYLLSSLVLLLIFLVLSLLARKLSRYLISKKTSNSLITQAVSNLCFMLILFIGIYLALKASNLSGLAYSIVGGTGALGLGLGLALKPTFENYISGLLISIRDVFRKGELVQINDIEGIVQAVTTRGTTLMDYEGNNLILPNHEVAQATIKNLTRNPNMRASFTVGIGYEDSINNVREIILDQLSLMPQVLKTPSPMIAADGLGASTVNLQVYFWLNAVDYSIVKVRSQAIQKTKDALLKANISMPDDAREVVFASPLELVRENSQNVKSSSLDENKEKLKVIKDDSSSVDLKNEIEEVREQADQVAPPDSGDNLLD